MRSWLKTGSSLSCRVHFEDLSPKELAFLLWPLIPEYLVPEECSGIGYHKIGIGKPLGLGLVEVRVVNDTLYLQEFSDIKDGYLNLDSNRRFQFSKATPSKLIQDSDLGNLARLPSVRAFKRIAYGFDDGLPVRYTNLEENRRNNKTDEYGEPKKGCGLAPRSLWLGYRNDDFIESFMGASGNRGKSTRSSGERGGSRGDRGHRHSSDTRHQR